jgi:hypothetical protein
VLSSQVADRSGYIVGPFAVGSNCPGKESRPSDDTKNITLINSSNKIAYMIDWRTPIINYLCNPSGRAVTPRPIPGPAILTPGSSLGSYIVPTDQHESFMHIVITHAHPRKLPCRSPILNCSKPSTINFEVLSR